MPHASMRRRASSESMAGRGNSLCSIVFGFRSTAPRTALSLPTAAPPPPRPGIGSPGVPLAHRAAVAGILAHPGASRKGARGLTLGPEDAQNPRDAPHGNRVVATDILPGRLVLGLRAVLAL